MAFIIELLLLAGLGYAGYTAYKTYVARGNSFQPLDEYFAVFLDRLLRR